MNETFLFRCLIAAPCAVATVLAVPIHGLILCALTGFAWGLLVAAATHE